MKTSNLFLYLFVLATCLLSACTKDNPFDTVDTGSGYGMFTISGKFLKGCNGEPAANTTFTFYQPSVGGGVLGTTTTKADGSFSFSYNPKNSNWIDYGMPNLYGYGSYGKIAPGNYNNIKLYLGPTCYLKVSMQVYNNSYTNQDTLLMGDFGRNGAIQTLKIPGPFTNGPMFDVPNYRIPDYSYDGSYIGMITTINNQTSPNYGNVKLTPCDTINYVVQIR